MICHCPLLRLLVLATVALCSSPTLTWASIEISATDSGNYASNGTHVAVNPNNWVRTNHSTSNRNFFVFDLSDVTDTILSATLLLENPTDTVASTYTLYEVTTDIATLTTDQSGAPGIAIYGDLGTGTSYGLVAFSTAISAGFVEIPLNSSAISALNAASGLFALGGSLSAAGPNLATLFAGTSGPEYVRKLILEVEKTEEETPPSNGIVPEPTSLLVWCGVGLVAGLGMAARRKS